jgi:integrase/recombinase XerD
MEEKGLKSRSKRGKRVNKLDVPQRFMDQLNTDGLLFSESKVAERVHTGEAVGISLQSIFDRYYSARKASGAAPRTLEDYEKHMRWFRSFMASEYSGLENTVPNREVIRAWILHMMTAQKLKPSTINIRLRTVKAMFNWAVKERILKDCPFENVELLRVHEEDFQVITMNQERRLFATCDLTTFTGLRDALLMSFLLDTGVRILVSDVELTSRSVLVRAEFVKTRKARTVYFGPRTQRILTIYLQWHSKNRLAQNLFLNEYGHPMDKDWATQRLRQLGRKAGISGVRISPHTFRHTFATRYIQATGDPFSLRRLLGHSSMEMVNRYVNQTTADVSKQYEKFISHTDGIY